MVTLVCNACIAYKNLVTIATCDNAGEHSWAKEQFSFQNVMQRNVQDFFLNMIIVLQIIV